MEILAQRIEQPVEAPTSPVEQRNADEPTVVTFEVKDKPPSISEPYINKMLELGEASGHFEMPNLIKEINEYVLSEFKRQNLEDTVKSYEEIVNHYLGKLNFPKGIDKYTQIENLHELMMIDKKLLEAAKAKEELLAKPISELTSRQLRQRIEEL